MCLVVCLSGRGWRAMPLLLLPEDAGIRVPGSLYRTHSGKSICWLSNCLCDLIDVKLFWERKNEGVLQRLVMFATLLLAGCSSRVTATR